LNADVKIEPEDLSLNWQTIHAIPPRHTGIYAIFARILNRIPGLFMKLLDWYILKKFLSTFVYTILVITTVAVVVDISEKEEDFAKSGLTSWQIVTHYFIGFVPFIMAMTFPLMVFIAVIFFTSKMAGQSAFIAILAGGVPYNRLLRPYLVGAIFLSLLFWVASQYWIPRANEIRTNFQAVYVDRNSSYNADPFKTNNYYLRVDSVTYVGMRYYDTSSRSARDFFMSKIRDFKIYYNLRAETIRWDTAKKNWKLENIIERKTDGLQESAKKIPSMNLNLNVTPGELRRDEYQKDKYTSPELREFIRREQIRGAEGLNTFKVEYFSRDATPFSVIIMTLMGVVVASRKIRGGSGLHLAFGLVAASVFVVMSKFSVTFSIKGNFPPLLAAWIPNVIFSGVTYWLYRNTPK
jgi:lipopolysaccharide export system permease protein